MPPAYPASRELRAGDLRVELFVDGREAQLAPGAVAVTIQVEAGDQMEPSSR
jgi:hypothetical protein